MNFSQPERLMPITSHDSDAGIMASNCSFSCKHSSRYRTHEDLEPENTLQSIQPSSFIITNPHDSANSNIYFSKPHVPGNLQMHMQIKQAIQVPTSIDNDPRHRVGKLFLTRDVPVMLHESSKGAAILTGNRIKWTRDLHERFVDCVNQLGGAKNATPKGIHTLMKQEGLTIFQVKSHLQKYRMSKGIPEPTEEGNGCANFMPQLDTNREMEIVEAIMGQVDVQKRFNEQLQLQIEEQRKQLKMISELLESN